MTAAFRDLNGDGSPDLYVCNDYWTPDRLWLNDGSGRFRAVDSLAVRRISASSMGVDFADLNHDGHPDIFAVDMLSRSAELRKRQMVAKRLTSPHPGSFQARVQTPQNTLLLNRGDGTFAEIACLAGLQASDWSWSPLFLDADLDGHEDVFLSQNFFAFRGEESRLDAGRGLWLRGDGKGNLAPVPGQISGIKVYGEQRGAALADFNHDGRIDLLVSQNAAPTRLYQNVLARPGLRVRLVGPANNPDGVGAVLRLRYGQ